MERRLVLVMVALVLLFALSILPWAGQTTASAEGCRTFGDASAQAAQTGELGTIVSGVAPTQPELVGTIILQELDQFCQ